MLVILTGGCQPKSAVAVKAAESGLDKGAEWTFKQIQPDTPPSEPSELSLGGTHLPVKILSHSEKGRLSFQMVAHDVVVDKEAYDVQSDKFSLLSMGDESVEPALPLLKSPMHIGDKWTWEGKITSGNPHPTKAVISSRADKLYVADKQLDAIVVEVNLAMESGGPAPAERRLSFWVVPGKGIVKREFGSGSVRQPEPKE